MKSCIFHIFFWSCFRQPYEYVNRLSTAFRVVVGNYVCYNFRLLKQLRKNKLRLLIFLVLLMINVLNRMGSSPRSTFPGFSFGHCGSLWTVVDCCGSLWLVVGRCGSLWVVPGFSNYALYLPLYKILFRT